MMFNSIINKFESIQRDKLYDYLVQQHIPMIQMKKKTANKVMNISTIMFNLRNHD